MGGVFNIGSDQPVTILELAQRVIAAVGPGIAVEFQSYAQAYSANFEDCRRRVPDLTRMRRILDFRPQFDLDHVIREVIAWKRGRKPGGQPRKGALDGPAPHPPAEAVDRGAGRRNDPLATTLRAPDRPGRRGSALDRGREAAAGRNDRVQRHAARRRWEAVAACERFEATGRLGARNELLLRLPTSGDASPPSAASPPGEIAIEIEG